MAMILRSKDSFEKTLSNYLAICACQKQTQKEVKRFLSGKAKKERHREASIRLRTIPHLLPLSRKEAETGAIKIRLPVSKKVRQKIREQILSELSQTGSDRQAPESYIYAVFQSYHLICINHPAFQKNISEKISCHYNTNQQDKNIEIFQNILHMLQETSASESFLEEQNPQLHPWTDILSELLEAILTKAPEDDSLEQPSSDSSVAEELLDVSTKTLPFLQEKSEDLAILEHRGR